MGYLDWVILSIIFVPILIMFGLAWNFIYIESKAEYDSKEKMLLLVVVTLLIAAVFSPLFIEKQEHGFVNLISIGGYLLSIGIVGGFSKKLHKWFSKGCSMVAIVILVIAFIYFISVKINPDLKNMYLVNQIENLDATSLSFAIVAMLLAGKVLQTKAENESKKPNDESI